MDFRLRHKETDWTVEEHARAVASELEIDAVGLWQVVPYVRDGFGVEGDALDEVLRYYLLFLFAEGAMPVVGRHGVDHWILKDGYGDTPEEMAASIVAEWRASGAGYPEPYDSLWFALPKMFKTEN